MVPLTAFTGSDQLEIVLASAETLGLWILLGILFGKMLAFAVSQASGFIGGPIFPVLFVGGTAGVIVNQVFPDVPIGLAFTCMLAAVPGAIVSAPFSLVLLAALLTQVGTLQTAPILIAVGTAAVAQVVKAEEEKFGETLDFGLKLLNDEIEALKKKKSRVLSGQVIRGF